MPYRVQLAPAKHSTIAFEFSASQPCTPPLRTILWTAQARNSCILKLNKYLYTAQCSYGSIYYTASLVAPEATMACCVLGSLPVPLRSNSAAAANDGDSLSSVALKHVGSMALILALAAAMASSIGYSTCMHASLSLFSPGTTRHHACFWP